MKIIDLYVVVDNLDPYNGSRVRAYPVKSIERTGEDPIGLLKNLDGTGNYIPWKKADDFKHVNDPYCFEPFLPKHLNIIPKAGDMIKVIAYEDNSNMPQEYITVNSTINNMAADTYRTADKLHTNNRKRPETDSTRSAVPGYNPRYDDLALISGKNADLILNDGRIILKAGHQKTLNNGTKQVSNHLATINIQNFPTGYNYEDVETTKENQTRTSINSIVEYELLDFFNNNITVDGQIYSFCFDIRIKTFQMPQYIDDLPFEEISTPSLFFKLFFNDQDKFINVLKKILKQLEQKQLDYVFNSANFIYDSNNNLSYKITDNRLPVGGVMPDSSINMGTRMHIRQNINQQFISDAGIKLIDTIAKAIDASGGYTRPKVSSAKKVREKTIARKTISTGNPESAIINGADMQFILSWKNNDYAQFNHAEYIPQSLIYAKNGLIDTTEPLVRGNQLLAVFSKLIDLILEHGHKDISDSRNTIDNYSNESLNKIKTTILNIKNQEKQLKIEGTDINDLLTKLVNHNLRIN